MEPVGVADSIHCQTDTLQICAADDHPAAQIHAEIQNVFQPGLLMFCIVISHNDLIS